MFFLCVSVTVGFLDPEMKLFSHRILSRDECIDPFSKTGNLRSDLALCLAELLAHTALWSPRITLWHIPVASSARTFLRKICPIWKGHSWYVIFNLDTLEKRHSFSQGQIDFHSATTAEEFNWGNSCNDWSYQTCWLKPGISQVI